MLRFTAPLFFACALALVVSSGQAQTGKSDAPKAGDKAPPGKTPKDTCVAECKTCGDICLHCMKHCDMVGHKDTARMCEACHHACWMCATAVGNKLPGAWEACETCEKMCTECAAMCEKHPNDEHMKKCAEECRKCAKACAEARK